MKLKALLAAGVMLLVTAVIVLAQTGGTVPPDPPPWYAAFAVFLIPALNLLGKGLLMVPVVPNKLIPGINAVVATVANYYGILGWDTVAPFGLDTASAGHQPEIVLAGTFGIIASGFLGTVQSFAASWFYEFSRKKQTKLGIWLEKGKRSLYNL